MASQTLTLIFGAVLLALGRKLYWLVTGAAGFALGAYLGNLWFPDGEAWLRIGGALVLGVAGLLLVIFLQKFALGAAGFVAGLYLATQAVRMLQADFGWVNWLIHLGGGLLGMVLALAVFEWALILLSSAAGAALVVQGLEMTVLMQAGLFVALFALGVVVQGAMKHKSRCKD